MKKANIGRTAGLSKKIIRAKIDTGLRSRKAPRTQNLASKTLDSENPTTQTKDSEIPLLSKTDVTRKRLPIPSKTDLSEMWRRTGMCASSETSLLPSKSSLPTLKEEENMQAVDAPKGCLIEIAPEKSPSKGNSKLKRPGKRPLKRYQRQNTLALDLPQPGSKDAIIAPRELESNDSLPDSQEKSSSLLPQKQVSQHALNSPQRPESKDPASCPERRPSKDTLNFSMLHTQDASPMHVSDDAPVVPKLSPSEAQIVQDKRSDAIFENCEEAYRQVQEAGFKEDIDISAVPPLENLAPLTPAPSSIWNINDVEELSDENADKAITSPSPPINEAELSSAKAELAQELGEIAAILDTDEKDLARLEQKRKRTQEAEEFAKRTEGFCKSCKGGDFRNERENEDEELDAELLVVQREKLSAIFQWCDKKRNQIIHQLETIEEEQKAIEARLEARKDCNDKLLELIGLKKRFGRTCDWKEAAKLLEEDEKKEAEKKKEEEKQPEIEKATSSGWRRGLRVAKTCAFCKSKNLAGTSLIPALQTPNAIKVCRQLCEGIALAGGLASLYVYYYAEDYIMAI